MIKLFPTMFTGLVTHIGRVKSIRRVSDGIVLGVSCPENFLDDCAVGDSIAVSGVCLTVTSIEKNTFQSDISSESINRTTIPKWQSDRDVNLEKSLRADSKLGGHFVMGHIDSVARIKSIVNQGEARIITFESDPEIVRMIVPKGSVSIDGISLTPASRKGSTFSIAVIPHTLEKTTLLNGRVGDEVNIEIDIFARYIHEFLKSTGQDSESPKGLDIDKLRSEGF